MSRFFVNFVKKVNIFNFVENRINTDIKVQSTGILTQWMATELQNVKETVIRFKAAELRNICRKQNKYRQ